MASVDSIVLERTMRVLLRWLSEMDMDASPPVVAQRIHRRLRELTGVDDPFQAAKEQQNRMALNFLRELKGEIEAALDPLAMAVRLAIAANIIDLGAKTGLADEDMLSALTKAVKEPVVGDLEGFRQAVAQANRILYLADNAGEIVFDLSDVPYNIFFLFKAKCPVIADHIGLPMGTHVLVHTGAGLLSKK